MSDEPIQDAEDDAAPVAATADEPTPASAPDPEPEARPAWQTGAPVRRRMITPPPEVEL